MIQTKKTALPQPTHDELDLSGRLVSYIQKKIAQAGGELNFAQFMEAALYTPDLGYYTGGMRKFGSEGDFVTAPMISPLFSQSLSRQVAQVFDAIGGGDILEFGPGTGALAVELMLSLEDSDHLPRHYYLLDLSADLTLRQQTYIQEKCPHLFGHFVWLNTLPDSPINGVIIANEVLDAMPVHCFRYSKGKMEEQFVTWENNQFTPSFQPIHDQDLLDALMPIVPLIKNTTSYYSEVNLFVKGWVKSLEDTLNRGVVLLMDYGFPRHEYYHPDRHQGTLMCHYRHHAHTDPFAYPGLQDITAHVDFRLVAESAVAAGFHVAGFNNQASFLIGCGLTELASAISPEAPEYVNISQQIKMLTHPSEMGELFKVMGLTKNLILPLIGFSLQDRRGRL